MTLKIPETVVAKKPSLEKKIMVYTSPCKEIKSVEQAKNEVEFLRKAYSLGMYDTLLYIENGGCGGGFLAELTPMNIIKYLNTIIEHAEQGDLPSKYAVSMSFTFNEEK